MNQIQSSRFKDAPWYSGDETIHCVVGGAGGIGSWLSLMLARAGYNPIVYDFDVIEEHNIGGQLFSKKDVDTAKVDALNRIVKEFADTDIMANNMKYDVDSMSHNYVFSAFDNMQARKDMFNNWKEFVEDWKKENGAAKETFEVHLTHENSKLSFIKAINEVLSIGLKEAKQLADESDSVPVKTGLSKDEADLYVVSLSDSNEFADSINIVVRSKTESPKDIPIFIDGRLLMEQLTIFCVTPDNMDKYEEHLFDDSEVAPEPCTLKQTSHSAAMIASHMVGFFTNHYANNIVGEKDRTVPFKWEYFIPINYLNEE